MKLETVSSAVQAYQGSVPNTAGTAKAPKAVQSSVVAKAPKSVSTPKTVNIPNTAVQPKTADRVSPQQLAEDGKIVKKEVADPDTGEKTIIYDAEEQNDVPENTVMQQNNKQIQEAVDKLKEKMAENTEAIFGIHEGTNRVMIKIVDKETKDVIKEFPPEKTLDMIQKVWEMAGIMVDEKL